MFYRLILLFAFSGLILQAQENSSRLTLEQARECLKTTKANPTSGIDEILVAQGTENKEILERAKIYQKQMASLAVLIANKSLPDVQYLIPFLGYASDPGAMALKGSHQETLDETKKDFPVFAAILNTPGAAPLLAGYCLDKTNPEDYRMTAFGALRFVDLQKFKDISREFNQQWDESNPKMKSLLTGIEQEPYMFAGMIEVKRLTNK